MPMRKNYTFFCSLAVKAVGMLGRSARHLRSTRRPPGPWGQKSRQAVHPKINKMPQPITSSKTQEKEAKVEPVCKPCCACPETRQARDVCTMMAGEEMEVKCADLIKVWEDWKMLTRQRHIKNACVKWVSTFSGGLNI